MSMRWLRLKDPVVQTYVGVTVPSLASDPVAEQVNKESTTTPEDGAIAAAVIVGAVFSTSTLADEVAVELLESVAVAVQVMVDPTLVSEAVTVYVDNVETVDAPTVHA